MAVIQQLGLVGCGLMGGSFALALKAQGLVGRVVGYSATERTRQLALQRGAIDAAATTVAEAVQGSDVVLVAVPVAATQATLAAIAPHLQADALVMDVGSTKADVVQAAQTAMGEKLAQFVPAHPIAGKAEGGIAAAEAALYQGCQVIVTPLPGNAPALVERATAVWQQLGAQVRHMTPHEHDAAYACVSHLPHLLAFAAMNAVQNQPQAQQYLSLAGPGFRDFTRIAASDPTVWRDILLANREQVLLQAGLFVQALEQLQAAMQPEQAAQLQALIDNASRARAGWQLAGQPPAPPADPH
jgi:prephenate dehydrogenase